MSLLLAFLPVEGLSFSVQDEDVCSSCRCCVQTNTNPAPVRNAPATASKSVRVDREARTEPQPFIPPALAERDIYNLHFESAPMRVPSVALFERHCSLLI
jgi:hypothetical protein